MDLMQKLKWLVCVSGFLDLFGVAMIYPLIVHRAKELGATPSQTGLVGSIYGSLQFLSSPLIGQLSDHVGRKKVLLIALIGTGISYLLLGTAESILFLSLARIPSGIFKHTQAMNKAYIADIFPSSDRAGVFGRFNSISSLGFVIGPTLGGYIAMGTNGFTHVAYLSAALFALNAVFNAFAIPMLLGCDLPVIERKKEDKKEVLNFFAALNAFQDAHKVPWYLVWDVFTIRFLMSFSLIIYRSNFTSILAYKFDTNQLTNGYIQTFNGIVSMVAGWCVDGISCYFSSSATMHNFFAIVLVASIVILTTVPLLSLYVLGIIPLCIASAILRVVNTAEIADRSGDETRGLVLGLSNTLTSLARALGPVIAGYALEVSYMAPGFCSAFFALLGTLLAIYSARIKEKSLKTE